MYEYAATLKRVVDGDTVFLTINLGFNITVTEKFRLAKINAPEMSTDEGKIAKSFIESKLPIAENALIVQTGKTDKYGRWLATIMVDGVNINDLMISSGHAVIYE